MHYHSSAFAISAGQETIVPRDPDVPVGLATELSELDILQANLLCGCERGEAFNILL